MQCRRGFRGGIILKDVSLFVFLPPKNTVSESVQICKFLHSLLSEPLHGSRRRAHAVRNFAPGLLLEIIPTDHVLLPPVQKPYVMRKPILLMAEIGVFGDQFFDAFSIELRGSALIGHCNFRDAFGIGIRTGIVCVPLLKRHDLNHFRRRNMAGILYFVLKQFYLFEGKYILGKSDEAMAEELSIKPASVRMALTRARQCAYQLLTKEQTPSRS